MPESAHLLLLDPEAGPVYSAVGDVYRILATGAQTGGAYALLEALVPLGGGPPPHIHRREDESFYVLEGEISFLIGEKKVVAKPGTFLQAPRGVAHAFKNEGDRPARMLIQVVPPGFEHFLQEIAHPLPSVQAAPIPVTPADIQKLLATAPKYGIEVLPPPQ